MPTPDRLALGQLGEDLACRELRRRGYAILARRYRTRVGELDIIARDGETVVFVEVKARATVRCGAPAEAVTPAKRRKLAMMAADYLVRKRLMDVACRFDVVAVDIGARPIITVFQGAFTLDS